MDFTTIGQVVSVFVVGAFTGWKAWRAERNSRPVGNGWTTQVLAKLDRIEERLDQHIDAHANGSLTHDRR